MCCLGEKNNGSIGQIGDEQSISNRNEYIIDLFVHLCLLWIIIWIYELKVEFAVVQKICSL